MTRSSRPGGSPKFSVLLPTHDRADVVGLAIDSLLRQTEPDFELLVVGDGCTDNTAEVVLGFRDPRVRWLDLPKAPNFGYANRNIALGEARGDLIAFVAHDDLALPDHLELLARPFERQEVEWAYSRPLWVSDEGTLVPFAVDLGQPAQLDHFLSTANTIPASCVVHRRSCLARFSDWPEEVPISGDWVLWKRMLRGAAGGNLAYVRESTILHFRASWRGRTGWAPQPFTAWHGVALAGASWPAALRVEVASNASVQKVFSRLLHREPNTWPAAVRRAIPEAIESIAWSQALALPSQIEAAGELISELLDRGSHERALRLAERTITLAPLDAGLHCARGIALLGLGEPATAESALRRAVALDGSSADYRAQLSVATHRQGRLVEAIDLAHQAVELARESADLRAHLGNLLLEDGRPAEAADAFRAAVRLDPHLEAAARHLESLAMPEGESN